MLGQREALLQSVFISVDGLGYMMFGLGEQAYPADETTDAITAVIASQQAPDGSWTAGIPVVRPPIEDSAVVRTALAVRTLATYPIAARKLELDERVASARRWLLELKPELPHDRSFQLLGLKWAGAEPKAIERVASEVRRLQRPDGGWAQIRQLPSDAYATGVALYALRQAGESSQSAVYRRGVRYLMASQRNDGSWYLPSRAPKLQPYFQSGFPYDHDQWISAAATAWSVAALSEAIEPPRKSASRF